MISAEPHSKTTILLVDDEPMNIEASGRFLSQFYNVIASTSGAHALELVRGRHKPALILLDVMMPDMDGYKIIEILKSDPDTQDIPVIFLTALSEDAHEERGFSLGAVDYIYKPCNHSILLARVRTQLELQRSRQFLKNQNEHLEAELNAKLEDIQRVHLQLLQSEKLAALGELAAGIAHEINNPIGFVSSNLNTLHHGIQDLFEMMDAYKKLMEMPIITLDAVQNLQAMEKAKDIAFLREDIPELVQESLEGLARVKNIIRSFKDFSHAGKTEWQPSDINQGLESTLNIVWNELKYHCKVNKQFADLPLVYCDIAQINQVFMNLLVNAAHAIKEQGEITITTRQVDDQVWVEVRDTGEGIAPENLARLFESFFTTKPIGKGTGLGLSISQNIVKTHGGRIEVESQLGQGSIFRVILPLNPVVEADAITS